jgi:AcrR family transcriptional regulator
MTGRLTPVKTALRLGVVTWIHAVRIGIRSSTLTTVTTEPLPLGPRPPQQARSRAALRKVLASAEHVLVTGGLDNFTMAAVAEHAGVSIGAVYRRFDGKEQLLDAVKDRMLTHLENQLAEAVGNAAERDIAAVIAAYTVTLAAGFADNSQAIPLLIQRTGSESVERARQSLDTMEDLFVKAASAHLGEIRHHDPGLALVITARTIVAACIHRTATLSWWPDISWESWQAEITAMGIRYLTVPGQSVYSGWPAIAPGQ